MKKAFLILSCIAALAMVSCGCKNQANSDLDVSIIKNPHTADGIDESIKMPEITFEKQMHDFGTLTPGENISYSFKFKNTGKTDLVISNCETTCGCTVPDYPKSSIAPGETGYITVAFKSEGKSGQQLQEVTVVANTQPSRTRLRIQAVVR